MTTNLVARCPNCLGKNSQWWPFGPCTICRGTGLTTPERAAQIRENQISDRKAEAEA